MYVGALVVGPPIPSHRPQNLFPSPTVKRSLAGGCLAPSISIKSLAPAVPQFAVGESSEQQIESEYPASFVQGVVEEEGTLLGTLLTPKYPTARQREHFPRSRLQQIE